MRSLANSFILDAVFEELTIDIANSTIWNKIALSTLVCAQVTQYFNIVMMLTQ